MKMYGIPAETHLRSIREGVDSLQHCLTVLEQATILETCVEAEFTAMSLYDLLRDITLWLHGARKTLDESCTSAKTPLSPSPVVTDTTSPTAQPKLAKSA